MTSQPKTLMELQRHIEALRPTADALKTLIAEWRKFAATDYTKGLKVSDASKLSMN
jgi:hypothetical protein